MADFTILSLRGGMNNSDPSIGLLDDQCVLAQNVEFVDSLLGERRKGSVAITLPAFLSARDRVSFGFRHLPTADETAAELWLLGVTGTTTAKLGRKTTTWSEITISDTPTLTGFNQYRWQGVSLHGKIHFAYKSNVDRLHVWDGTSMRRSGLAEPSPPTAADTAGVGTIAGTRYGRIRIVEVSGSDVLRRSEPSTTLAFAPSGTKDGITWTRPTLPGEGETHWEIELSTDGEDGNFYRMARIAIATTTHTDSVVYDTGYAATGTLSEDIEDYALLPSARYLTHDEDRLLWGGSHNDPELESRVGWTPVYKASGVGNDERSETDTDPFQDLDAGKHGALTGLSEPVFGAIWAFKQHAIYKGGRTRQRTKAYDFQKYTDALGAVHGSVVSGLDPTGNPCLYFIDDDQGACRIGLGGIIRCGDDVRTTWKTLNADASAVITSAVYYPAKKQVIWNIATGSSNTPDKALVLHTDKSRDLADGARKGWSLWTGNRAKGLSMWLYADNVEAGTARSLKLVPFIGLEGLGLVHQCDTGDTDNAVAYVATITTKPYWFKTVLHQFTVMSAAVLAKAVDGALLTVKCIKNFATETTSTISDISLEAADTEVDVIKMLDELKGAELQVAQFQFTDGTATTQWQLNQFVAREEEGQTV